MKTNDLISMLARGPIEADASATTRRLSLAAAGGLPVVVAAMWVLLGPRHDLAAAATLPMFWMKFMLPLGLAASLWAAVWQLARPGERGSAPRLAAICVLAVFWAAAAFDLATSPSGARWPMVEGLSALPCVASIALLSLPLLAAMFVALRGLAPTRLRAAGAAAGALSGSLAALIYAVHCTEMTLPFLAVWYVLGMSVPAVLGALAGPRLLRWA